MDPGSIAARACLSKYYDELNGRFGSGFEVLSQQHEGWTLLPDVYDDGCFSGGNMERPGLTRLLADVEAGRVDVIVVY